MTDIAALRASPLTPSEIVLLNGEAFAPPAGLSDALPLLASGQTVAAPALARALLAAAFLAAEAAGDLRLEVRPKPTPFGVSKVRVLYAEPGDEAESARSDRGTWPAPSLEARLRPLAAALREVALLAAALLEAEAPNPWHHTAELVQRQLAERGLLATTEVVRFGFVKAQAYRLPEATRALAAQAPVAAVKELLEACQRGRPEVWAQLGQQIDAGLRARLKAGPAPVPRKSDDED